MDFSVRDAIVEDASAAARVMRVSIKDLCVSDHKNKDRLLSEWLGNKTEANVRRWIESSANWSRVAVQANQVVGIAMLNDDGKLLVMYVLPGAVGCGIGSQLMAALEAQGRKAGLKRLSLESTITAKTFYEKHGFKDAGSPVGVDTGMPCFPMTKRLSSGVE